MRNIVILISGRGTNMQAIVDAAGLEKWPARIAAIISNKAGAEGLSYAAQKNIPTAVVANTDYPTREAFDTALRLVIDSFQPDLVVLAGFMRILSSEFVHHYDARMLNIHPSLLPSFPGLKTHRQALEAGVKVHGATVHFVTPDLDHGPIVAQVVVPVLAGDTEASLAERVLAEEHIIYPRAVRWFIEGHLHLENNHVQVAAAAR